MSVDASMIFCTVADMLLLFTLICIKARKFNVHIVHVCIMYNHFHLLVTFTDRKDMEEFMSSLTWTFAVMYNKHYGLKGKVFKKPYRNVPKVGEKSIKSNMIYIANNPVVKSAVTSPSDYRWNFLRYAESRHPFSEEYVPIEASKEMQYLVKAVRQRAEEGEPIDYRLFESKKFAALGERERQQLIDIIIDTYNVIDYGPMLQKYGSVEEYCRACDNVEGEEWHLRDDRDREDYRHYPKMMAIAGAEGYDMRKNRYTEVPSELAERLLRRSVKEVGATALEIEKLFKIKNYENR